MVALHVVRAQANRSYTQAMAMIQEQQRIRLQPLRTKGKANWSTGIQAIKGRIYRSQASSSDSNARGGSDAEKFRTGTCSRTSAAAQAGDQQAGSSTSSTSALPSPIGMLPQMIFLYCPKCLFAVDGTRAAFVVDRLDHKTWCKRCHRSWAVQDWQCACHMPWHACPKHSKEPCRLRSDREGKRSRRTHTAPKRPLAEVCTEEGANMLDEAGRPSSNLLSATDEIDLGPKQPKGGLLPALRQRYRRILQADPGKMEKALEGETSREVSLRGGRLYVEPRAQASSEEASPANTREQQEGSKRGVLWRNAASCDHSETATPSKQAGIAQHGASTAPANPQGTDTPSCGWALNWLVSAAHAHRLCASDGAPFHPWQKWKTVVGWG